MTKLFVLILLLSFAALAQQQLPSPAPRFRLGAADFVQRGNKISTIAWRADNEGGLDVTAVPCEGRYVLSFTDSKPIPFNVNSVHTFLQRVELFGHVFESDNLDPLVFRVDAEGFTWVRGKGNVTVPAGGVVQMGGVTVPPDQRTFLLPPNRQSSDLTPPSLIGIAQKFAVCGVQLQISSLIRKTGENSETITVRLAKGSSVGPADVTNRVYIALVDAKEQRFKPDQGTGLTWDTITKEPGITFEVPKGMTPVVLEVEGTRFNIQSIVVPQAR